MKSKVFLLLLDDDNDDGSKYEDSLLYKGRIVW
jgi:hypothetical protein